MQFSPQWDLGRRRGHRLATPRRLLPFSCHCSFLIVDRSLITQSRIDNIPTSSKGSRCASRVRSSLAGRWEGSHSFRAASFTEGLPGTGLGSTSPLSRRRRSQRLIVGSETEKVSAISSRGLPASTAASTRIRRSMEYAFMFGDYHQEQPL